jgi:ubiquinone/menaquinone biosynthesis C-methylase UbiE
MITAINKHCSSVLNVGCGIATNRDLYSAEYYGVDVTPKFIEEAHRRGANAQVSSVLHLPFKDNCFDCVCCENLLVHLPPKMWKVALDEMFRVSSVLVALNEPPWTTETVYEIREEYFTVEGTVRFYLNDYGEDEVLEFLKTKKVRVCCWRNVGWQVTLMYL